MIDMRRKVTKIFSLKPGAGRWAQYLLTLGTFLSKIQELRDVGQVVPDSFPNENGMF